MFDLSKISNISKIFALPNNLLKFEKLQYYILLKNQFQKYVFSDLSSPDFQAGHQELGIILENKVFQKLKFSKNVNNKNNTKQAQYNEVCAKLNY